MNVWIAAVIVGSEHRRDNKQTYELKGKVGRTKEDPKMRRKESRKRKMCMKQRCESGKIPRK